MDTNRALVLQDARVDDGLVVCSSGVGAQAGGIQIGTEAYDFKTMVTNSVFARCGKGDRGGAIGFQGAYGHDQTVFYGTGLLAKVRFVDVGRTLWHPAPEGNEARGTCEWGGMALWVRDVGTMRGDGYVGFPCARGGSYPDRSNLKLVPVSQRGSIRPVLFDGSQQHSDPFRKGAYAERLTPRTSPALIKGLAPAGR
jgi:hypothetical protein